MLRKKLIIISVFALLMSGFILGEAKAVTTNEELKKEINKVYNVVYPGLPNVASDLKNVASDVKEIKNAVTVPVVPLADKLELNFIVFDKYLGRQINNDTEDCSVGVVIKNKTASNIKITIDSSNITLAISNLGDGEVRDVDSITRGTASTVTIYPLSDVYYLIGNIQSDQPWMFERGRYIYFVKNLLIQSDEKISIDKNIIFEKE